MPFIKATNQIDYGGGLTGINYFIQYFFLNSKKKQKNENHIYYCRRNYNTVN